MEKQKTALIFIILPAIFVAVGIVLALFIGVFITSYMIGKRNLSRLIAMR